MDDSRKAAQASEAELWEYLIAHNEVQDFNEWVISYRLKLENDFIETK